MMILNNTTTRILNLTCDQAEIILIKFYGLKFISHVELVEKLLFQIINFDEVRSFLTRNLFFDEVKISYFSNFPRLILCIFFKISFLRKKLSYAFKVLIGNVCGHYVLNLNNDFHRIAGSIF
jgi:hypothetical protein